MKLVKFECPNCGDTGPKDSWEEVDDNLSLSAIIKYVCSKCGYEGEIT